MPNCPCQVTGQHDLQRVSLLINIQQSIVSRVSDLDWSANNVFNIIPVSFDKLF